MKIKIGSDRFWVRAANIERWAEILKSLPEQIQCKSKKDIAKDQLGYKVDDSGRIVNADEVYGLFGAEGTKDSITLVGCNFIKKDVDRYILTDGAFELIEKYKNRADWESTLVKQLLMYSIRVRCIAYALLNGGVLKFKNKYLEDFNNSCLDFQGKEYLIFSSNPDDTNINCLLNDYASQIIGCYWRKELELDELEDIEFVGINKEYPALGSSMSSYLKIPLMLFDYLGLIVDREEGCYILDKLKLKEKVGQEVLNSLVPEESNNDIDMLLNLIDEHSDARGFFPISVVGALLKEKISLDDKSSDEQWIDKYFVTGINQGRFKIKDYEQGQPRHGRGLLNKKDYQLIKLEIRV